MRLNIVDLSNMGILTIVSGAVNQKYMIMFGSTKGMYEAPESSNAGCGADQMMWIKPQRRDVSDIKYRYPLVN